MLNILRLQLLLIPVLYVMFRVGTLLHELGHLTTAWAWGVPTKGITISILGGGVTRLAGFPEGATWLAHATTSSAGMVMDLIVGSLALYGAKRTSSHKSLSLGLATLGAMNWIGVVAYWTLGLAHRIGDPWAIVLASYGSTPTPESPATVQHFWLLAVCLAPIVSYVTMRFVIDRIQQYSAPAGAWSPARVQLVAFGAPAALFLAISGWRLSARAADSALIRFLIAQARQYRIAHPTATTTEVQSWVRGLIDQAPQISFLDHALHLVPYLALILALGVGWLVAIAHSNSPPGTAKVTLRDLSTWYAIAFATALLLWGFGQPLFAGAF